MRECERARDKVHAKHLAGFAGTQLTHGPGAINTIKFSIIVMANICTQFAFIALEIN